MLSRFAFRAIALVLGASLAVPAVPALAREAVDCHVAAYRLADGQVVDVAQVDPGEFRWRRFDGETGLLKANPDGSYASTLGWTGKSDGRTIRFSDCATGTIQFGDVAGRRVPLAAAETTFLSGDVELAGRLVLPPGPGPVPIVVLIHGSEFSSALDTYALQRLLPAEGVGVFVYDKRGTGASKGSYTQDYSVLADDAVAALGEARRMAGPRAGRIGYQGGSQGGWVAPLAATRAPVDFVIVSFGLAVSPVEEDNAEIELEMKLAGHGPGETAKALEVAAAAQAAFESLFTDEAIARFVAVRDKYKAEPWYIDLKGNLTRYLLPLSADELRAARAKYNFGTPFHYDAMPVLRRLDTPQLWILGEEDLDAPSAETARRLQSLIAHGKPITLAMEPGAEHGMTLFETAPDGERLSTRFAPGYFEMMRDFIRDGRLARRYGDERVTAPR
jgi:pimeloyl-ACP methyl ester carboxylesterase